MLSSASVLSLSLFQSRTYDYLQQRLKSHFLSKVNIGQVIFDTG